MKKILFIEDNPKITENLSQYKGDVYEFTIAKSYDEYLAKRDEKAWDMVITDLFFPGSANSNDNLKSAKSCYENILLKMAEYAGVHPEALLKKDFSNSKRHDVLSATYRPRLVRLELSIDDNLLIFSFYKKEFGWKDYSAGNFSWQPHLNKYWGEKGLDYSVGPFGAEVYLEMYHKQKIPTIMITSDHAHHSEGSLVIGYIQQRSLLEYGEIAFNDNKSELYLDIEKPYSMEKLMKIIKSSQIWS